MAAQTMMQKIILAYFLFMNIVGLLICAHDKRAAINRRRRVREKTLFVLALLGGAAGVFIAMLIVRHKTRHWYFMVFMPLIGAAQAAALIYWFV